MRHLLFLLATAVVALFLLASCGSKPTPEQRANSITTAEKAMEAGNIDEAVANIKGITSAGLDQLSAAELTRLAILYMQAAERSDNTELVGMATKCYDTALKQNPDTVNALMMATSVDAERYLMMLGSIVRNLNGPAEIPADEPMDSLEAHAHH